MRKKYSILVFQLIVCITNLYAQKGGNVNGDTGHKMKHFIHSVGITNAVHYDFLREARNDNHLKRQDNNVNWAFRLFYEINYKNTLALEVGLNYLLNSKSNYNGNYDSMQRKVDFEIMRGVPQVFINTKFYPSKIVKGYFIGLGYTRIKASYGSAATNYIYNHIDYDNTLAISNVVVFSLGKEFKYKKLRGDIRVGYYKHSHFDTSYFKKLPSIIFLDNNFNEIKSYYWYDAIEFGITFIL